MGKLEELLTAPERRRNVVADCVRLIDEEVDARTGLSGLAIKGAYRVAKAVRSSFIDDAVDRLLPRFVAQLEPFWAEREARSPAEPMEKFLSARSGSVAEALLAITDERAGRAERGPVVSAYEKLRPSGRRHVEDAVPRIGRLIDRHTR